MIFKAPAEWKSDFRRKRLAEQVEITLMDHSPEFDIVGIVNDLIIRFPDIRTVDSLPAQDYWGVVEDHDLLDPEKRAV